jgi:pimeloyl-ACP methyl ester carboxylesterase
MQRSLIYLPGIAGSPADSPVLEALKESGWNVMQPILPGFDGRAGFRAPDSYLDWLTVLWDAIDAAAVGPCPVIGASVGGMLAAELAMFRPELVSAIVLLAPFGIADESNMGLDIYAVPATERMSHLFAKGVPEPFVERFGWLGPDEGPVARYLCDIAAASLVWPVGDRGLATRLHRLPAHRLVIWGDQDELLPVGLAARWGETSVIAGAGHLVEWDAPDEVSKLVGAFLDG